MNLNKVFLLDRKTKIFLFFIVLFFLCLAFDMVTSVYQISQDKYIVVKDVNVYTVRFIGGANFKLKKRGEIQKGDLVYRKKKFESKKLENYFYIDTDFIHKGSLQGFIKKENVRALTKEEKKILKKTRRVSNIEIDP